MRSLDPFSLGSWNQGLIDLFFGHVIELIVAPKLENLQPTSIIIVFQQLGFPAHWTLFV